MPHNKRRLNGTLHQGTSNEAFHDTPWLACFSRGAYVVSRAQTSGNRLRHFCSESISRPTLNAHRGRTSVPRTLHPVSEHIPSPSTPNATSLLPLVQLGSLPRCLRLPSPPLPVARETPFAAPRPATRVARMENSRLIRCEFEEGLRRRARGSYGAPVSLDLQV